MLRLQGFVRQHIHGIPIGAQHSTCSWTHTSHHVANMAMPIKNARVFAMEKRFSFNGDRVVRNKPDLNMKSLITEKATNTKGLPLTSDLQASKLCQDGQMVKVAEAVENTANMVEEVAEVTEKVSAMLAKKLPEDGTLRNTALFVEHVIKEAHIAKDFIHKVDELKHEVIERVSKPSVDTGKTLDKEAC